MQQVAIDIEEVTRPEHAVLIANRACRSALAGRRHGEFRTRLGLTPPVVWARLMTSHIEQDFSQGDLKRAQCRLISNRRGNY